jgi:hypothetical protein
MDMQGFFSVALLVVLVGLGLWWHFGRSSAILQEWAGQNGYRIVSREYRTFFKGPFFWTSAKGQAVYHVVVEDSAGHERSAWVRCGSWLFGLLSDNVDVRWDD